MKLKLKMIFAIKVIFININLYKNNFTIMISFKELKINFLPIFIFWILENYNTFNKNDHFIGDEETLSLKSNNDTIVSQTESIQSDIKNINSNNSRFIEKDAQ